MKNIFISFAFLAFGSSDAWADVVTKCVSIKGHSYFFVGKLVQPKSAGWHEDGITDGSYVVTRDAGEKYDVIYTDASNRTVSSTEDGGTVLAISKHDNYLVLLITYPEMNIETWYFKINRSGAGELTMSQARYGEATFTNKHSLMRATCSK